MVFVSLFRNPIASLLGDALDVGSSCPFGFASTRLFGCGLFACRKSLCSISFPFIIRSTLLWHCSVGRPLLVHHFPAASSLMLNLLGYYASYCSPWSLRSPSTWTARVPPNIVYLRVPISYCWTCSLAEYIPFSYVCFRHPTCRTTEPGQGSSPLYHLSKVSSIWMLVFFFYPRI
jgi:hypothetical protein